MAAVIAVIGSSGSVGKAVVSALSSRGASVRAIIRDPSKAEAVELAKLPNVTVVAGDSSQPDALATALKNVQRVFINVPGSSERTQLGINAINASKAAGVGFISTISVLTAVEATKNTIFGGQFIPIEETLKASGIPYAILRAPLFIDNGWGNKASIQGQGKIYSCVKPNASYTPVAVQDIADSAATILTAPENFTNKTYNLTAPSSTYAEEAAEFTAALGKQVDYVQVPPEGVKAALTGFGMPEWQQNGVIELLELINAGSPVTNNPNNDIQTITGREPTSVKAWIRQVAPAFK